MHKWLKAIVIVFTGLVLAMGFSTHAFGIAMTVLPNGKIMVTDIIPGTTISTATVTYGPHGNVRGDIHVHMGPRPAPGDNRTFTEIITPRIINEMSENTNLNETQQQQPYNAGSTVSNVTGNATELNGTSENGNEISSNTNEIQQQLPQIIQLNNGSIIVNGTMHTKTDCSQTDLTQDERYTCGYNHGYLDARTDWNLHRFPPQSGGDDSCPHATEHTPEYCNGYAKGYTYEWNTLYQGQQTPPKGPSLDTLYNKGLALIHLGNYIGAIEYLDRVLAVDPNDKDALYYKGDALLALGNYTGVMLYYDRVLTIDPKDVAALDDKGLALNKLGNHTGAILYYDKALAVDPKHENALYNKGLILHTLGNDTGALTYLDKALAITPKDEDALYEKGVFLDKLGNHTGAIEFFNKALAIRPHDVDALNKKGTALNSLGNHTGAILYYDKVLAIDPQYVHALDNKGTALNSLGNYTGAILYYDKALAIDPYYADALNSKGGALENLGNNTGAILYYDKALAINPHYDLALNNKGAALDNLGNHTGAILYYDKALTINPKYEDALYNKGYDLATLGNHTGAIEYFDKALAIDPHDIDALNHKGLALDDLGNYTGAIKYYDKALAIDPNNTYALDNKGIDLNALGNHTGAILYHDRTLAIEPHDVSALTGKGDALGDLGNYTEAMLYYDKALAIDPQYVSALNNKGLALDNLGNYTGAILYYNKALIIQPNDTYALNNKAAALDNLGNHTGSIVYYNKALAIDPKNTFALTNKAAILHMLGNNSTFSTYENSTYGIRVQYPSDWSVQELKSSGERINVAAFVSPTGPDSDPTAWVSIHMDTLENSTTNLDNYAHFVVFPGYKNWASHFHAFKLIELSTNSSKLAGRSAYALIGTYELHSFGLQKLMEVGTIIGDKVYSVHYIADASQYSDYLPIVQHIIGSLHVVAPTPGNAAKFLQYRNSIYGIKIQYPSDWRVEGGSNPAIIASFYPQRNYTNYVMIQIENLSTGYTPDQYLNSLMLGDAADYKAFPDIRFNQNTTNNIVIAGHPGYLLNGTFRDPTTDALQRFTNIGTIIGDKVYSIIYYSPAETYPVYITIYDQMIKSFEVIPQNSSAVNPTVSTYQNGNYGILIQYPSDWSVQESKSSGEPINVATFVSPTGPDSDPTADVSIYLDKLHNLTTNLDNYAHFVAFTDYENKPSYFHAFKLLELSTNSSILAGKPAYTIIGTYQNPSFGLQQLMETGTIIGDKAYSVQYIADARKYSDYLPIVQKMIDSLMINKSLGTGSGSMLNNNTNLHPDNLEKCHNGLCYVVWTRQC